LDDAIEEEGVGCMGRTGISTAKDCRLGEGWGNEL
jgi:hypothetical protein